MLKVAICDDDQVLCHSLERMVVQEEAIHGGDVLTEVFFDGESLCDYMKQGNKFDLVFLDIEMGNLDGVSAGHQIREVLMDDDVQLIYISSKDSYAMELFAVRPMNFLIKPLTQEKLSRVLTQAYHLIEKNSVMFEYRINKKSSYISTQKIKYFEVVNRKIIIHTQNEDITYYGKMSEVLEKVKKQRFLQINRSELVNYDAIEMYQRECIKLYGGKELQISRSRVKPVQDQIFIYAREDL